MRVAKSSAAHASESILIASDNSSDAALVKELLSDTFGNVFATTVAEQAVDDFEHRLPQVLVLAFDALEKAERYCLGLDRLGGKTHSQPHRTVILCDKNEVRQVVELCIKQTFDDYVLFWPMNHDAYRLRMAVHHALRELALRKDRGPSVAQFDAQARRLSELEALLDQQVDLGRQCIDIAIQAIRQAERDASAALQGFSRRLCHGALPDVVEIRDATALEREIAALGRSGIQQPLQFALESIQAIRRWVDEFRQAFAPHQEPAGAPSAPADQPQPTILIVDDDDFQRKIVAKILEPENYQLLFAASGADALNIMRTTRPDLVLMDVLMPGMDGIETTRRLKAIPQLAAIAVIMITGKSQGTAVVTSMQAGASDFLVKPFDRDKLIAKVAHWSRPKDLP